MSSFASIRPPAEGQSLLSIVNSLLRHRRLLVLLPLGLAILGVTAGILLPRSYLVSASFTPQSSGGATGRLIGLAAQFGIPIGESAGAGSPEFYQTLLSSPAIFRQLVESRYDPTLTADQITAALSPTSAVGTDLMEFFEINEESSLLRRERAVEELADAIDVSVDLESGVVSLSVRTESPAMSWAIAQRAMDLVTEFNLHIRQSQAAAERKFVEERLAVTRDALRTAEDDLKAFQLRNRLIQGAPDLMLIYERLQREVALQQQLFITLSQAFEQARIDEVRDTPIITVIEQPVFPIPERRGLALKMILGIMVGVFLALVISLFRDFVLSRAVSEEEEQLEYQRLVSETRRDLRTIFLRRPSDRSHSDG